MGKEYSEQLKHPLWQRKRLEILERDRFTCSWCASEDRTLHVHHTKYVGKAPWETPGEFLITLCETCHERATDMNKRARDALALVQSNWSALERVVGYMEGSVLAVKLSGSVQLSGPAHTAGIADAWDLKRDDVRDAATNDVIDVKSLWNLRSPPSSEGQ